MLILYVQQKEKQRKNKTFYQKKSVKGRTGLTSQSQSITLYYIINMQKMLLGKDRNMPCVGERCTLEIPKHASERVHTE